MDYDRERVAADLSWFFEPTFLAKTRLGLGVTTGQEEVPQNFLGAQNFCLLYTSPSPRDRTRSRMPSSA